ncbi:hypothetical protein PHK61_30790 [Actinomycetospora lutea]|uniref:hypothetical protein n=1 Tax=Actinomycetospora lutea TaxID=663604 RepID=UPI0023658BCD|nr:hypothetical protein [Actinomycetospora lutea]MDD7942811.1 hypothetical protein [Actinomycetospora lutea]
MGADVAWCGAPAGIVGVGVRDHVRDEGVVVPALGSGAEQGEVDIGADGVEQPRVPCRLGPEHQGLHVRDRQRPGIEREIEPREVQGARRGAPRPYPALAAGAVVAPGGPGGVEGGSELRDALDQPGQRRPRRLGQHRAHDPAGVLGGQRRGPGDTDPDPVGVDAPGVPRGPQLGDRHDRGVGLPEQPRHPGAGLGQHRAQLVGPELAVALPAPAGAVGVGPRGLPRGEREAGLVMGELAAPRRGQHHRVVRGHRPRIDPFQQRAQRRTGRGRGDPLRQRREHLFEHAPRLAPTPDNHGPIRDRGDRDAGRTPARVHQDAHRRLGPTEGTVDRAEGTSVPHDGVTPVAIMRPGFREGGGRSHVEGVAVMAHDPQAASPLLEAVLNLAHFHQEHERFYSSAPLETAVRLQRHARTLQALADRWSTVVPSVRTARNPYEGAEDLNSEAAIALDGALFMEGEGRPAEITAMIGELRADAEGFAGGGEWLADAMQSSWKVAASLIEIDDLADVMGERHRIITNDWLAANMQTLIAQMLVRAAEMLDHVDFTPGALRADMAGGRVSPRRLHSAAEVISRAADLCGESSRLVHDNQRRWRVFRERADQVVQRHTD